MTEPLGDGAGAMAQAQVQALVANADSLGLTWQRKLATVSGYDGTTPLAVIDGDSVPIAVIPMISSLYAGQRVYVDTVPPGGNYVVGYLPGQIGVRARVSGQATTTGVQATLAWGTIDQEDGGDFIAAGGTTFTVPASGLWAITLRTSLNAAGGARNFANIAITSAIPNMPSGYRGSYPANETVGTIGVTIPLLAGDTFNGSSYQEGGNRDVDAWMSAWWTGGYIV